MRTRSGRRGAIQPLPHVLHDVTCTAAGEPVGERLPSGVAEGDDAARWIDGLNAEVGVGPEVVDDYLDVFEVVPGRIEVSWRELESLPVPLKTWS
jgi:hypothetical protein